MRKLFVFGFLWALLLPTLALAQSAFDGTWKLDMKKAQMSTKPDVLVLQNGMYHCKTCVPPIDIKADGTDQKVTGHPYYDMVSVKVVDDHTVIETDKKDGKVVTTSKTTISSDGKMATFEFSDSSATNADPVTGKGEATRVAKGPAGSHAVSGSWKAAKMDSLSDNGVTFTYKVDGEKMSMTTPTGQSYAAKLDGTDAPYMGDPGTSSVSLKRISKSSMTETDKRDGKVISISHMTVAADGKSMKIAVDDKLHGTTSSFVADKQ